MRKLSVFNFTTLNGFFKDSDGDTSWHGHGEEGNKYAEDMIKRKNILLFGRVTYEMMAGFWPTEQAKKMAPVLAEGMNNAEKIVFSKTLKKALWQNTTIIKDQMIEEIKKLKKTKGADMTLLGSGSILTQLAENGLIDEYQIMIDPLLLGAGTPVASGLSHKVDLKLTNTKIFKSGMVLLCYEAL